MLVISSMTLRTVTNVKFSGFDFFLHILKGYTLIYQLSKFQAVILLNF